MDRQVTNVSRFWLNFLTIFLIFFIALFVLAIRALKVDAEVAVFLSETYVEQGVEVVDESGANKQIQYDHLWTDFAGSIPEGAIPSSVVLRLSWTPVTRFLIDESPKDSFEAGTPEGANGQILDTITHEENMGASVTEDTVSSYESEEITEEAEVPSISDSEGIDTTPLDTIHEEVDTAENIPDPVPEADMTAPAIEEFEQVSLNQYYQFVSAQLEESVATSTLLPVEVLPTEVVITESISTTSGFVSSDIVSKTVDEKKSFEVRYTIDGVTWNVLGSVGFDESHETIFEFDLSHMTVEALASLQIAIRYTISAEDQTKIIFDSVQLEVAYTTELLVEKVVEPIRPDDNEPNFEVSSIKADVQSENIRAVMLERGGVFEFWYSITEQTSGDVTWSRLAGASAIDMNAPIAIKERTIFWLDRNQQTLFGFSVDTQALFGVSFLDYEKKTFSLPFTDEDSTMWEAVYDSMTGVLEFNKVPKVRL